MAKRVGLLAVCLALTAAIAVLQRRGEPVPAPGAAAVEHFPASTLEATDEAPVQRGEDSTTSPREIAEPHCTVEFHVVDEDGEPVQNARLRVGAPSEDALPCKRSAEIGVFQSEVSRGDYVAHVEWVGASHGEGASLEFTIAPGENSRILVFPIHYRWIDGATLDAFGTPLPGAHVLLHQPDMGGSYPQATTSGPDGTFRMWCSTEFRALLKMNGRFDGLARGDPALPWTSEGISDVLTLPAGARHAVLRARTLDAGGSATFMVADDSGLARPWVEVIFGGNSQLPPRRLRTGDDGCVRMDRVPRDEFEVSARFIGDDARSKVWILPERVTALGDGRTVIIRAQRGVPARGKIIGPDGQPLYGAEIKRIGDGGSSGLNTESTEDGSFTLLFPPDVKEAIRFRVTYEPVVAGRMSRPGDAWIGRIVEIAPRDSGIEIVLSPAEESPTSETAR